MVVKLAQALVPKPSRMLQLKGKKEITCLAPGDICEDFCKDVVSRFSKDAFSQGDVDQMCYRINNSSSAEQQTLPNVPASGQKLWISSQTLDLIDRCIAARLSGNVEEENQTCRDVKKSARCDGKFDWTALLLQDLGEQRGYCEERRLNNRVS